MSDRIFESQDYKTFIIKRINEFPNGGRGVRRQLGKAMGCQVAYVSQVLSGEKHLSLEQAEAAARFFGLRDDETEFFILLVELSRAGTNQLWQYFRRQLDKKRAQNQEIKSRLRINRSISAIDQSIYYSSWHYQAIHSLLTIPGHKSSLEIAERLAISPDKVGQVLSFLLERGLIEEKGNAYISTQKEFHLPRTSPLISKLHTNWRVRTLTALEKIDNESYHYSGLITLSSGDVTRVREILLKALAETIEVVKPSKEEKICLLAMDLFEL